ncbi:hypothetical protein ACFR9U_20210 [Halorientalis brevis]|uniref:Uncharacterized protein n=1 Tax=Halorientalis brevis TaxID=1126241 RepID=A0ABD6CHG5_9EURY|nr:hypothetical protein [Halorientalis brevis]
MSPDDERSSRRAVLQACGGALATGLTALSGCGSLPPLGPEIKYGSVTVPTAGEATYQKWLPAAETFPPAADVDDGYDVQVYAPPPDAAPDWTRNNYQRHHLVSSTDFVGVGIDDVDLALGTDVAAVLLGDIPTLDVHETLAQTSYEPVGTDGNYEIYTRPDTERAVGVSSDAVVFGTGSPARENLTTVLAARRGDVPRYDAQNSDFATVAAHTGVRRWAWLWPGEIRGTFRRYENVKADIEGLGMAFDHDESGAYYVETWLFPSEYDVTVGEVKTALKQHGQAVNATAVDVDVSGRTATIAMTAPIEEFREDYSPGALTPSVTWSAKYSADAQRLTITHEAGDSIPLDTLTIQDHGVDPIETGPGVGERLDPGELLTVTTAQFEAGATVRVLYEPSHEQPALLLYEYELP